MGWRGLKNGQLLDAAEAEAFDLVITADKNLRHQQNFSGRRISMLELWTNNTPILERHFARIRSAVEAAQPAKYTILDEHTQSTDEPPSR